MYSYRIPNAYTTLQIASDFTSEDTYQAVADFFPTKIRATTFDLVSTPIVLTHSMAEYPIPKRHTDEIHKMDSKQPNVIPLNSSFISVHEK